MAENNDSNSAVVILVTVVLVIIIALAFYFGLGQRGTTNNEDANGDGINVELNVPDSGSEEGGNSEAGN